MIHFLCICKKYIHTRQYGSEIHLTHDHQQMHVCYSYENLSLIYTLM